MHLGKNGSLNWWSLVAFEKTLDGPKISFFESRNYGAGLDHLLVELSLRDEKGPKRDFIMYRSDPGRAQFCLSMGPEIKAIEEVVAFRTIGDSAKSTISQEVIAREYIYSQCGLIPPSRMANHTAEPSRAGSP